MRNRLTDGQVVGVYRRNVGAIKVSTIHDGMLLTGFDIILGADQAACEAAHLAAFRSIPPRMSCNSFVIDNANQIILVDAGCGSTEPDAGRHPGGLAMLGIIPDDVEVVLVTHMHRDHIAGLVNENAEAVFRSAELVVHEDELAFWQDKGNIARLSKGQKGHFATATTVIGAYRDRLRPVREGDVLPGISAVPTPGHTPGHTAWRIDSNGEQLLIWGDVVHLPVVQFAIPEASVVYDLDSTMAAVTRRRLLDMLAAERLPVAGVHLDFPCFGWVEASGHGFSCTSEIWTSVL